MTVCYKHSIRPWPVPERLMQRSSKPPHLAQLKLFHPPIISPCWDTLPSEIRHQILPLLARLLREHGVRAGARGAAKEDSHE